MEAAQFSRAVVEVILDSDKLLGMAQLIGGAVEVVIKETVYKPDSVIKQYGTVKAKITTTQRTLLSEGDLMIAIRDLKGLVVWSDRFTGEHRWKTEFATYSGDERALSDSDKAALNKSTEYTMPRQEQIMEELFKQIQNDFSYLLRARYSLVLNEHRRLSRGRSRQIQNSLLS